MTTLVRRWGPWAVLVAVAVVVLAVGLNRPGHPSLEARAQSIEAQVRCPVCNGETVAQSQAAPSVEIRNQIHQELQAGESQSRILSGLVRAYGPGILEKPQTSGIGILVWVLPVVGVVLAASGLVLMLRRWRLRTATTPDDPEGPAPEAVTPEPVTPEPVTPAPATPSGRPGAGPEGQAPVATTLLADPAAPEPEQVDPDSAPPHGAPPAITAPAGRRPARWGRGARWAVTGTGVALIAAGASWAVVASSGTRLPGQSITGEVLPSQAVARDLQAATADAQRNDAVGALQEYEKVLKAAPKQVEALSGMGWLLAETGQPALVKQGLAQLTTAEQVNPDYGPAHLYRGLTLLGEGDYQASVPELQWYLAHNPAPQLVPKVKQALTEAQAKAAASPPAPSGG